MKTLKYVLSIAATLTAIACVQEENPVTDNSNVELVPMTFTVTADTEADTKVFYDGEATKWEKDDKIMVISANGIATEFTATEVNGATATFEGETEQSDKFYAVYPADAYRGNDLASPTNTDQGGRLYVNVPEIQTAVAGTFDKNAFVSIAESEGDNLNFKNLCSVVKFNLDNPEGVKSVRFTMTSNNNLAGTGNVYVKNITVHNWGEAIKTTESDKDQRYSSNMITLKAPDGGFLADTDYYFVQRAYKQSEDKTSSDSDNSKPDGVQFYIEYEDNVKVRNGASAFDATRNTVVPVGTIDDQEATLEDVTPYDSYNLGFDLVVAGKTINKATYGDATLISSTSSSNTIGKNGVYFIDSDVTATLQSGISKLIVIGNDNTKRSNISKNGESLLTGTTDSDIIVFKDIVYTPATDQYIFRFNTAETFENIIFDNCYFSIPSGVHFLNINAKPFNNFSMTSCDCMMDTGSIIIHCGKAPVNISNVTFDNNVIFANSTVANTALVNGSAQSIDETVITNNTLYKVVSQGNGFIYAMNLESLTVTQNLFYDCVNVETKVHSYIFKLNAGTLTSGNVTSNSSSTPKDPDSNTKIRVYASNKTYNSVENPSNTNYDYSLANWDPENGKYDIDGTNGAKYYGATR